MSVSYVNGVCIAQHRIRRQVPICREIGKVRPSTYFGGYGVYQELAYSHGLNGACRGGKFVVSKQ